MKLYEYMKRAFEHADANARDSAVLEFLVKRGIVGEDEYVTDNRGDIQHVDDVFYCDDTGEWYASSKYTAITVRIRGRVHETWCSEETEDWFYDEVLDEYFCDRNYCSGTYSGQTICIEAHGDLYYWESDGEYHDEPEGEEEEDGRSGYHSEHPGWRRGRDVEPLGLGIELEIEAKGGHLCYICDKARSLGLIPEEDGSLNDERGVEIVGRPFKLNELRKGAWGKFIEWAQGRAIGWDAGTGYGMHVSIGRNIPRIAQGKFLVFIHSQKNLCEIIAGRREVHWSKYKNKTVRNGWDYEGEKYEAAAVRGPGRIEVRIFRSTLRMDSFLKNAQFVDAAREFAITHSIRDMGSSGKFIAMVHRSGSKYRELSKFLKARGFTPGEDVERTMIGNSIDRIMESVSDDN